MFRWSKPSPGGFVLHFGSNSAPLHALPDRTTPLPQTQCTPAKWDFLYPKMNPPTLLWPKPSPNGLVLDCRSNSALLAHCPIAPPHHLKPSVCLPNRISSTRKRTPPTLRWPKLSPGGSVLEFGFNPPPPPLRIARSHPTTYLNANKICRERRSAWRLPLRN